MYVELQIFLVSIFLMSNRHTVVLLYFFDYELCSFIIFLKLLPIRKLHVIVVIQA